MNPVQSTTRKDKDNILGKGEAEQRKVSFRSHPSPLPLSLRVVINLLKIKLIWFGLVWLSGREPPTSPGLGRTSSTMRPIRQLEMKSETSKDPKYISTPSHEEFSWPGILLGDERMSWNPITMRICNWSSLGSQSSYKRTCACIQFRAIYYI